MTGTLKWSYTTRKMIDSSPTVVNGILYIGSYDDKIYALDAATGTYKWSYTTGGAVVSSPTVVNGILYVGSDYHKIYALYI